jgi:hypothetical protein
MSVSNLLAACVTVSAYTVIGNPRRESQASEDRHSVRAPVAIRRTQLAHIRLGGMMWLVWYAPVGRRDTG